MYKCKQTERILQEYQDGERTFEGMCAEVDSLLVRKPSADRQGTQEYLNSLIEAVDVIERGLQV